MNLIQVVLTHRLRQELPDAMVQRALTTTRYVPMALLARSFLIEGHFRSVAGASKSM
jgi:hypothetical protein